MTAADRTRMRELLAKATPRPWNKRREEFDGHDQMTAALDQTLRHGGHVLHYVECDRSVFPALTGNGPTSDANAALIVEAINALPDLLDELDGHDHALEAIEELLAVIEKQKNALAFLRPGLDEATATALDLLLRDAA